VRGELRLPSPEGVQYDDTRYPLHYYTTAEGAPDVPDHVDRTIVNHYINNPP
jgi:hypothetical protein